MVKKQGGNTKGILLKRVIGKETIANQVTNVGFYFNSTELFVGHRGILL